MRRRGESLEVEAQGVEEVSSCKEKDTANAVVDINAKEEVQEGLVVWE